MPSSASIEVTIESESGNGMAALEDEWLPSPSESQSISGILEPAALKRARLFWERQSEDRREKKEGAFLEERKVAGRLVLNESEG